MIYASTAWKLSKYGVFLVRIFLYSDQKKFRIWKLFTQWREELAYSLVPNCRGGVKLLTLGKSPQVYLIIMREWPKNNPLVLRNLDNCPLVHFIRPPTIRHKPLKKVLLSISIKAITILRLKIALKISIFQECTQADKIP